MMDLAVGLLGTHFDLFPLIATRVATNFVINFFFFQEFLFNNTDSPSTINNRNHRQQLDNRTSHKFVREHVRSSVAYYQGCPTFCEDGLEFSLSEWKPLKF